MNLGSEQSPIKKIAVKNRTACSRQSTIYSTVTQSSFRQRQKDKEHLRMITTQLQNFVEKKKNLESENKLLRTEIEVLERENLRRLARVKKTYEEKINTLRSERKLLDQETEDIRKRLHNAIQSKNDAELKCTKACEEKDCYEIQLIEARKDLVASNAEVEKLRAMIGRLDRERNKQKEVATSIRSQNTTLILQKTTLEEKLRNGSKITQKHQGDVEQLRRKIAIDKAQHRTQLEEQRKQFEFEKNNIQRQFKEKLDAFCKERSAQFEKDKETWMQVFRNEVETKMRGLSETNQCLGHNAKVLEEKNEECQTAIASLNQEITKIAKDRDRAIQSRQELEVKLDEVQKLVEKRVQELEKTSKRYQREHEKMKQVLIKKDNKLIQLEKEQVDYFQEINAFQQVLATADDNADLKDVNMTTRAVRPSSTINAYDGDSPSRLTKKRRISTSASIIPADLQIVESPDSELPTGRNLGFSVVDLEKGFFEIKNHAKSNTICLKGYYVTNSTEPVCRHDLPGLTLGPGEKIRVLFGPNWRSSTEVLEDDILWEDGVWANAKDAVVLWNTAGEMVANYKFEINSSKKNCSIM